MSIDNTVAIGVFPTTNGGKEYRVIEASAIENFDDNPMFPQELTDATIVRYYSESPVFTDRQAAFAYAVKLENEAIEAYGCVEYGIRDIEYPRPFPSMTVEEAKEKIDAYWNGIVVKT